MSEEYDRTARTQLRWQWGIVTVVAVIVVATGYVALSNWWMPVYGVRWAAVAGTVLMYELWLLRRYLERNRRVDGEQLWGTLGVATAVTLARGGVLAAVAGFLAIPEPTGPAAWLPGSLYAVAVAFDWVDGWLARWFDKTTLLGAKLDIEFDGVGLLVAGLLGIAYGVLPLWYLVVGLARPAFLMGIWLHRRRGGVIGELSESNHRRQLAGLQMFVCSVALLPAVGPPISIALATVVMVPFVVLFARDFHTVRK